MTDDNKIENSLTPIESKGLVRVGNSIAITSKIIKEHEERIINQLFPTVKIGNQIWMTKNLDVDCYANGDIIPEVQNADDWKNIKSGAWCYFMNDSKYGTKYGKIYNWYVLQNLSNIIPTGFKLPSKEDWEILKQNTKSIDYPQYEKYPNWWCATHLKSINGWNKRNGDNLHNFNALPCGHRNSAGKFKEDLVGFWSCSIDENNNPYYMFIHDSENLAFLSRASNKNDGWYIRCIKL